MAETMQDNLNGQLTILKSQLEELAISFGDILMPTIRKIVSAVQQLVDKLNSMDEGTRETIIKIGLLAASIGPLLIVLGKTISTVGTAMRGFSSLAKGVRLLITHVGSASGVFSKLGVVLGGLSGPVVAVVSFWIPYWVCSCLFQCVLRQLERRTGSGKRNLLQHLGRCEVCILYDSYRIKECTGCVQISV